MVRTPGGTVVLAWIVANLIGGYVGGHIATRKGDKFAMDMLLILMAVSGVFLIATAL